MIHLNGNKVIAVVLEMIMRMGIGDDIGILPECPDAFNAYHLVILMNVSLIRKKNDIRFNDIPDPDHAVKDLLAVLVKYSPWKAYKMGFCPQNIMRLVHLIQLDPAIGKNGDIHLVAFSGKPGDGGATDEFNVIRMRA